MIFGPLLTAKEAADFLRTSVWTLLRACTEGDLDHVMVNEKACRFTMAHLQAFVARFGQECRATRIHRQLEMFGQKRGTRSPRISLEMELGQLGLQQILAAFRLKIPFSGPR